MNGCGAPRLEPHRPAEALLRITQVFLLLLHEPEVQPRPAEVRRQFHSPAQHDLRVTPLARLHRQVRQQAQGVHVVRALQQHVAKDFFSGLEVALPLLFQPAHQRLAVRRELEGGLEGGVSVAATAEGREDLAELHLHGFASRLQLFCALEARRAPRRAGAA